VLDLSALRFIDARGLGAVISSVAEAARRGWDLQVDRNLSACLARLLELTGAADYVWPGSDAGQASSAPCVGYGSRPPVGRGTVAAYHRPRGSNGRQPRGRRPPIRRLV